MTLNYIVTNFDLTILFTYILYFHLWYGLNTTTEREDTNRSYLLCPMSQTARPREGRLMAMGVQRLSAETDTEHGLVGCLGWDRV